MRSDHRRPGHGSPPARRRLAGGGAAALVAAALAVPATAAADTAQDGAAAADASSLGPITDVAADGDTWTFTAGDAALRVTVAADDVLHVEMAPDGQFTDPDADPEDPDAPDADIVVGEPEGAEATLTETDDAYLLATDAATLTVTKDPATLHLADADGTTLLSETAPLSWSADGTTQSLARGADEQFFGGGMQNGRFSHRGEEITISRDYNWDDGGNPNASPFYLSSHGYGVLRHTFAPGTYDFDAPVRTTHEEQRYDAYLFVGDTREVLDDLTALTGRPAMLPMYAMELGDADCYLHNANRGERETLRDATAVADGYREHDMPLGWMLVNDGYGCGYEDLGATGDMLADHGAELGLWTESDLTEQESEVAAGVRVRKTDVAWVGPGYRFALDACEQASDGITDFSADRSTVLTVEGWAGTQRCGAVWSGDQSGSWEYIRWQIPTYAGTSLSGQPTSTGDVDGIFGGSPETYVRDLQWKMLLPMTYAMSGWAASDKQPWRYGEPYTSINRTYLQLHERLLPYLYTYVAEGHKTGLGATRPLYVNYPEDPKTWGDDVKYEFLAGDDLLVAPVYEDSTTRDGIYLPAGRWVDYWTGRVYDGEQTLDGYHAPLDTLPLFVRAGAIVPMFDEGTLDWAQGKESGHLDLDVYPQGDSTFTAYEDDGRSQEHADGASARQRFDVSAPEIGAGPVEVTIGALDGDYAGRPDARTYGLTVHTDKSPDTVRLGRDALPELGDPERDGTGWWYDAATGVVHVTTPALDTSAAATVRITGAAAVGGTHPGERAVDLGLDAPAIAAAGEELAVTATLGNGTGKPLDVTGAALTAPEGWAVTGPEPAAVEDVPDGGTATVTFQVTPPDEVEPGSVELAATADYVVRDTVRTLGAKTSTTVAHGELADAFDNVGITTADDPAPGDIDGGGSSFLAGRLAEQGATPGAQLTFDGFDFTWPDVTPGTPDNVASSGQTVRVSGQGNALAFLGTGTSGSAAGTATVHYADGSTSTGTLGFANWCCLAQDSYGSQTVIRTLGKNTPDGPAYPSVEYRVYTSAIQVDETKEVVAVTLPGNAAVHVFALDVGTTEFAPPPVADGQYRLTNAGTGLSLAAPGNESTQVVTAEASTDATQKWILERRDDGSYEVRNAASGQCLDVFWSSREAGALVGQYSCSGGPNQSWTVTADDGALTLAAKHSGLVLSVDGSGAAVQVEPTDDATQRWEHSAS
ncbi:RICIN domain-containing protein [Isoptericola sp. BMS4]|uniref:RICIN domain-containing protein n=1 Tax=Isoptericola sp. BMS4 TaxID=2527875 RepID=UPI00141EF049|nr:RICIN domain-containing protein [Isoptericola sp. BMS4]